jgi:hypothetical protein
MKHNSIEKLKELFGDRLVKYEYERVTGIYLQTRNGIVNYVGRTQNIHGRQAEWRPAIEFGMFDEVYLFEAPPEHLIQLEAEIITHLRPERNSQMHRNGKDWARFIGPLPFELTSQYLANPMEHRP